MASVCPVPYSLTWAIAASRPSTTASAMSIDRNSARNSSSDGFSCTVTPASCSACLSRGRALSAIAASISSDSAALHTLGRRVLALSRMRSADIEISRFMNVDVAIADPGLDGRHRRVAHHCIDQACSPARDHDVDQAASLDQMGDAGAVCAGKQLHGIGFESLAGQRSAQRGDERRVRVGRRRASTQQHRVAGLERQSESVDRDIGPAFVDDADDTERNPLLTQLQSVGQRAATQHFADRVGQAGDLAKSGGDAVDALRIQRQPVEHGVRGACSPGGFEILFVGGQDLVHAREHGVGRSMQRAVLGFGTQRRQRACCNAGPPGGVVDLRAQVG